MPKLKLVRRHWRGHAGDNEAYELFVDGQQWFFPSGAGAGRTEGEILKAYLRNAGYELEETSQYEAL